MSRPLIERPAQYRHFFGIVHQFAAGAAQGAIAAGSVGNSDSVAITGEADWEEIGYRVIGSPDAGLVRANFQVGSGGQLHFQGSLALAGIGVGRSYPWATHSAWNPVPRGATFLMIADDRRVVQVGSVTVRLLHVGEKIYPRPFEGPRVYLEEKEWRYVADFTTAYSGAPLAFGPIAANGGFPAPVKILADHDFEIRKVIIVATSPEFTLQIWTSRKNIAWFNVACHAALLGATTFDADPPAAALPFVLPSPIIVEANGSLNVQPSDLSGAQNSIQVIFEGRQLKPAGGIATADRAELRQWRDQRDFGRARELAAIQPFR